MIITFVPCQSYCQL